jgi:hypothetical protein
MTAPTLGRLEKVGLRQVWRNEAGDFTPWLGLPENLKLLGEAIGMDLELEAREKDVGPYSADLFCKNTLDSSWVLIENQLEKTDHVHLGQIMTYAAALEAQTIIWVAERFTEEHRAALDWLNEITNDRFSFLGLEIELWRIGNSPAAPKFNVVSKPNDWARDVQSHVKAGELTDAKRLQLKYWTAFRDFMAANSQIRCQNPQPQHWMNHAIGTSGAHLASIASFWDSEKDAAGAENRTELYLDGRNQKDWFKALAAEKDALEAQIGQLLHWYSPDNAKMSRIYARQAADLTNESKWPEQFQWLKSNLELFSRVFGSRIKTLSAGTALSMP